MRHYLFFALKTAFSLMVYFALKAFMRHSRPNLEEGEIVLFSGIIASAVWWGLVAGLSGGFVVITFCILLYFVCKWLIIGINPAWERKAKAGIMLGAFILCLGLIIVVVPTWGERVPGSLFERDNYTRMIYVRMYPGDSEAKSYTVPALITAYQDGDGYSSYHVYSIDYAVMPNGGKIVFGDGGESLKLHKRVHLYDEKEREWEVELTDNPAADQE